ncbi:hypothetical protein DCE79_10750 [Lysinibacillus sp. 2017]|uniref:hypothetical protein n=1 Tax=unclassified Lysinibacillus TaxID=2636778 RepID=UPI000D528B91|nr:MULTISPECIES: hypothetical protein [unclassified Lysinibacillus]AWE07834.1 hypothetical protein DCE79_10750 [Lysinibacillus sp. 2017]TGN32273.1 hypothetical protein E4L99_15620 [Lysinibacillus sp. S2017]
MKNKIIPIIIAVIVIFGTQYLWEQYQTQQLMNEIKDMEFVNRNDIAKLVVASYPSMNSYSTWDKTIINEAINALAKLEVENTRKFKESNTYYKVKLSDDENFKALTYTFYDNNFVKKEDLVGYIGSTQYFKTEDTLFGDMFYPLLEAELNK